MFSGIATGSKHCSHRGRDVFIGECSQDTSKTIVVNTHQLADSSKRTSTFEKVILIVRNPYDLITDEFSKVMKTSTEERQFFITKGKSSCHHAN